MYLLCNVGDTVGDSGLYCGRLTPFGPHRERARERERETERERQTDRQTETKRGRDRYRETDRG